MSISGFTFVYNAIDGGFPIVEAVLSVKPFVDDIVAVDIGSTDNTNKILVDLGCKTIKSILSFTKGRQIFIDAYNYYKKVCKHDTIIFFEADEVYDVSLLNKIVELSTIDHKGFAVWRLQLEQNFQRCRWYPYPVHRIIRKGHDSYPANPVISPPWANVISPDFGFLWDVSSCFRDNWVVRRQTQKKIWTHLRNLRVAEHFASPNEYSNESSFLSEPQWTWKRSPFAIPDILKPLVGVVKYDPHISGKIISE